MNQIPSDVASYHRRMETSTVMKNFIGFFKAAIFNQHATRFRTEDCLHEMNKQIRIYEMQNGLVFLMHMCTYRVKKQGGI
jgi:hypothetical protein